MSKPTQVLYCAAAMLLAACGGGGSSAPTAQQATASATVPDRASQGSAGLTMYLTELSVAAADDTLPLELGDFSPAQPDDTEPEALR